MSFIDKIKSYFSLQGKKEIKTKPSFLLRSNDLGEWFKKNLEKRLYGDNKHIRASYNSITKTFDVIRQKLDKLKNAKLKNEKIPIKERQIMEGNRKAFIEKHNLFLDSILIPDEKTLLGSVDFIKHYKEKLALLRKSTQRSYMILQHFYENEIQDVLGSLNQVEREIRAIKECISLENVDKILSLRKKIEQLGEGQRSGKNTLLMIQNTQTKIKSSEADLKDINAKIERLQESPDAKNLEKTRQAIVEINQDIDLKKKEVLDMISPLDKAFKKFERVSLEDQDTISSYRSDAVFALSKDIDDNKDGALQIKRIAKHLEEMIDKLNLKDKIKQKTLNAISKLDNGLLAGLGREINSLESDKKKLMTKVDGSRVSSEIKKLNSQKSMTEEDRARLKKELQKLNKYRKKRLDSTIISDIEADMMAVLDRKVILKE